MAACEFWTYKHHVHQGQMDLVEICGLTRRPCFVQQPHSDTGRLLQLNCTRRTWALEHGPGSPPPSVDPPGQVVDRGQDQGQDRNQGQNIDHPLILGVPDLSHISRSRPIITKSSPPAPGSPDPELPGGSAPGSARGPDLGPGIPG